MKTFFSFSKLTFLFYFVLSAFATTNISVAMNKQSSSTSTELDNQCFANTLSGEDDLIPWPFAQCPWSMDNLYGSWLVKGATTQRKTPSKKVETYKIFSSSVGVAIVRHKLDGTQDSGFVIKNRSNRSNLNNYYNAFMYSSSGGVYYLSIYAYLPKPLRFQGKESSSCLDSKKEQIKGIILMKHKTNNFLQCEENFTESWLLERQ